MTEQADKYRQAAEDMNRLADLDEDVEVPIDSIEVQLDTELKAFTTIMSEMKRLLGYQF